MTRSMLFLPYTPRADSDARGYDDWLRRVDNPFFNSRPGIAHYSNWKVARSQAAFPYTHFDFLLLAPGATADDVWGDAPLAAFAAEWVALWGVDPEGDPAVNYQCHLAAHDDGDAGAFAPRVAIMLHDAAAGERWRITESVVGTPPAQAFTRRFLSGDEDASDAILGELIAAPDLD